METKKRKRAKRSKSEVKLDPNFETLSPVFKEISKIAVEKQMTYKEMVIAIGTNETRFHEIKKRSFKYGDFEVAYKLSKLLKINLNMFIREMISNDKQNN